MERKRDLVDAVRVRVVVDDFIRVFVDLAHEMTAIYVDFDRTAFTRWGGRFSVFCVGVIVQEMACQRGVLNKRWL